eukprot:CAMPEP_0119047468 /NCGR_PEP_ID=MMETSP1177-20130426/53275_1 /TAXON_ID=2985 /ORGANISM="Ochromonas sp, Strain CCMP1899" /LENGTH=398 /DNA_ID=CAMNT_0007022107 /DNA_START=222 /DNA_END=1415 /DNA_ORIENTATION=+
MNDSANLFGKPVRFREYHVKMEELEEMRYKVDILADECLIALQERGETIDTFISYFTTQEPARYEDPRINDFIKSIEIEPEWLNWDLLKMGQHVFLKHAGLAGLGLLYVSLIGGFAAPKIGKVLDATSYMTKDPDRTFKRLLETFEMVVDCVDEDDALKRGNRGFNSVVKVRFLHSRIRLHLLKKSRKRNNLDAEDTVDLQSGGCPFHQGYHASSKNTENQNRKEALKTSDLKDIDTSTKDNKETVATVDSGQNTVSGRSEWNTKDYGFPINQEDMVATLLSFSIIVLDVIEDFSVPGSLNREDKEAYLHLWRYIGYLIGLNEDLNPCVTVEGASGLIESIVIHLIHPDERSGAIARHVIKSQSNRFPANTSYEMHSEMARAFLGNEMADALGLHRSW